MRAELLSEAEVQELDSLTCTAFMKNIILSVDENVLAAVRSRAAEQNSTVSALVRENFTTLVEHEDRATRAPAFGS